MQHKPDCDDSSPPIRAAIQRQGFCVCNFAAEECCPAFSYSVGLHETQNHPEFLAMGLSVEMNSHLVVAAAEAVKAGETLEPGHEYSGFIGGYPIRFVEINKAHMPNHFGFAREYYEGWNFSALQIIWPDKQGKWPWDDDVDDNMPYCQKMLDRQPHFAFYAPTNLTSFCSRGVFDRGMVIYDAIHEEDGGWQFLSKEPCTKDNVMLVCLEEVVKKDPTLNELFNLPHGKRAWRKKKGDEWIIEDYEEQD